MKRHYKLTYDEGLDEDENKFRNQAVLNRILNMYVITSFLEEEIFDEEMDPDEKTENEEKTSKADKKMLKKLNNQLHYTNERLKMDYAVEIENRKALKDLNKKYELLLEALDQKIK